jgi:putative membrane protein
MDIFFILVSIVLGTLLACFLSCLPGLHIYNVAGVVILLEVATESWSIPVEILFSFMMSLIVAYSILNTIPSIFLGAPDESAIFITLPGNRYLMLGKGYDAAMLTGLGSLGGICFLVLLSPFASFIFPIFRAVVSEHLHWVLGAVLGFLIMSEWPKGGDRGQTSWKKFWSAWQNLVAGLITLLLSGLLGFIILDKNVLPLAVSFQNIMPAFVGLFAIPWVVQNISSKTNPPLQYIAKNLDIDTPLMLRGIGAGCLGGLFAAIFPIITAGMGGLLAGHATAQRDDRLFIVSQGASKTVYYVGGFMLLFIPGLMITKGGMAWMVSTLHKPAGLAHFYMIIATICISGAISIGMLHVLSKWTTLLIAKINYRFISIVTLVLILLLIFFLCQWQGLFVMAVASGIGMIPVFFHSRRMNCMGILLIPVMLKSAGYGTAISQFLGLIN